MRPVLLVIGGILTGCLMVSATHAQEPFTARQLEVADSLMAPPPAVPLEELAGNPDSVTAAPGVIFPAGGLHRFLFGDLNRDLWALEIRVPVLDLDEVGGGLEFDELSGGAQTLGMHFRGADGQPYQFRSVVKNAARALPEPLRSTPFENVLQDQIAALFPLSAVVVAELLEASGVLVAKPRLVVMPDDPRLGDYRAAFAGRMGWIEERPNEGEDDEAGFAGSRKVTGSEEFFEELRADPRHRVDQRELLRARLIDMLVSDWDRHLDQWRWASFEEEGGRTRWEPIPRDRDWALAHMDGLLTRITRIYYPKYEGFNDRMPDPFRMSWTAMRIDHSLLSELTRADFRAVASGLREQLTDDAIDRAVGALPPEYEAHVGARLRARLRYRRDGLERLADEFYELLARWVDVYGSNQTDHAVARILEDGGVELEIRAPVAENLVTYHRRFLPRETSEVRIYLLDGADRFELSGDRELDIELRVIGMEGDDSFEDRSPSGAGLHIYDAEGDNSLDLGSNVFFTDSPHESQESPPIPYLAWQTRDWGSVTLPRPELRYDTDLGPYLGVGFSRYGFGFGREPFRSRISVGIANGFAADQWIGDVEWERPFGDIGWETALNVEWFTQRPSWFFGLGNEVPDPANEDLFRGFRNQVRLDFQLAFEPDSIFRAFVGPSATVAGAVSGAVFDTLTPYGAGRFRQAGARAGLKFDTRDHYGIPSSGLFVRVDGKGFPEIGDAEDAFGGLSAEARTYVQIPAPGQPTLHLRAMSQKVWGRTPYSELPHLGGARTHPGYTERRFLGDAMASGAALLRLNLARLRLFTEMDMGVHGVLATGRVWLDGEDSDRWHPGYGGGIWLHVLSIDRVLSATYVKGRNGGSEFYLDLGLLF